MNLDMTSEYAKKRLGIGAAPASESLTVRDFFAGLFMAGRLSAADEDSLPDSPRDFEAVALDAYLMADMMLDARDAENIWKRDRGESWS